jgi:transposase-like protein
LKEDMTMRRMTKKARALILHAEGATVEEIARQLDTQPSYSRTWII